MLATEGFRPNRLSVLVAGPINTVLLHHDHLMRADMMARVLRVVGRAGRHVDPLRRQMFRGRMEWLRHPASRERRVRFGMVLGTPGQFTWTWFIPRLFPIRPFRWRRVEPKDRDFGWSTFAQSSEGWWAGSSRSAGDRRIKGAGPPFVQNLWL